MSSSAPARPAAPSPRASRETGASVILLEAGPSDWHPMIHIPAGMRSLIRNPLVNWNYTTEPEKGSGDRRIEWPRGRTLGGSSSINGMLYVRGAPADFDGWAQMGCRGWSYDDVLPYLHEVRALRAGRRSRGARPGRPAQGRGLPHHPAAHPPLRRSARSRRASRSIPTSTARQRARRRLFADDAARPLARLDGADLPARGARPPQPAGRDQRAGRQADVRGQALRRRHLPARRPAPPRSAPTAR